MPGLAGRAGRACRWGAAGSRRARRPGAAPRTAGGSRATQCAGLARGSSVADDEGHDPVAPLLVRYAEHLDRRDLRVLAQPGGDRRRGHVDPAADDHVVDPAEHVQPPVLVEPAGVRGQEPTVDEHLGGPLGLPVVPLEERRPADPDPTVAVERERDAVERVAVVDAAAGGLRRAVRRDHAHPRCLGAARSAGSIGPPPSSTVWKPRRASASVSSSRCSWVGTSET